MIRCANLERIDASWCLRSTPKALKILASASSTGQDSYAGSPCDHQQAPPLCELNLEHLGAISLEIGGDGVAPAEAPGSPGNWKRTVKGPISSTSSPIPSLLNWLPSRLPPEPPSMSLPPPAQLISPPLARARTTGDDYLLNMDPLPPSAVDVSSPGQSPSVFLKQLVSTYASSLQRLLLDGIRNAVDAEALHAIASNCPALQQLALTFSATVRNGSPATLQGNDAALEGGLRAIGASCNSLTSLSLDSTARPHRALSAPLAPPSFGALRSLSLACSRAGGLLDGELEMILHDRTGLENLELRNCEGLSDSLFQRWTNRECKDQLRVVEQLDEALLSSILGMAPLDPLDPNPLLPQEAPPPRTTRRRQIPKCASALALRSVTSFSLCGATSLSDGSVDALAELLHDAQTVHLRGCPLLTEHSLQSFRKGCRFLRSATIVARDRTLSWTAATSGVKRHRHQRSSFHNSGSSGTESN